MAEEKKIKNEEVVEKHEEVEVEKKFCTNCGKELINGEACDCTKETKAVSINIDSEKIVGTFKDVFNIIINTIKKPDTTITKEVNNKDVRNSLIISIIGGIFYALFLLANISVLNDYLESSINNLSYGFMSSDSVNINISYFKVFIYGIIVYALIVLIPVVIGMILSKLTKNNLNFKKCFKLYVTSFSPMVLAYLVGALVVVINISILNTLAYIAIIVMGVVCFFNFILGFNKLNKISDNKRSYALAGLIIGWVVVLFIAIFLVAGSVVNDIQDQYSKHSINNTFRW